MAIVGRVRIDLSTIPTQHGMPAFGHDRAIRDKLSALLESPAVSPHTPVLIDVGRLRSHHVLDGVDAGHWAALATRFEHVCIEGRDPENVERWVGALKAAAIGRSAAA